MTDRERLPDRRRGALVSFDHDGLAYVAQYGFSPTGSLLEIFLDVGKTGTTANIVAKEAAVVTSLALQYGVPIEVLRAALPGLRDGSPAGPLGLALGEAEGKPSSK
ncbi:MAG TPA: hypothetical protein VGG45_16305 [Terracidiphilus sp.]|jgi:ribonucleoside-diphosphate reductase alpha chain